MHSKWLIFGTSPFVNEVKDFSFAKKYQTIAINNFDKCPAQYRCAIDKKVILWIKENNCKEKLILNKNLRG
jgi:hypothetical protein